jgi:hypothetical protein
LTPGLVRRCAVGLVAAPLAIGLLSVACAKASSTAQGPTLAADMSAAPPSPDPRVGLRPGRADSARKVMLGRAAETAWNIHLVSNSAPAPELNGGTNSDLAFIGKYAIQGNYNGWTIWDISNPRTPVRHIVYVCPGSQSDVSVYRNLLFVSGESQSGRLDCGTQGVTDSISHDRLRGIRVFDISDVTKPKYLANVQTCRGSHTHTVVVSPNDTANVYIYISGSSSVRSPNELPGCSGLAPERDPNTALFRIEVIQVPLAAPQRARIVSSPRIFQDLTPAPRASERVVQDSIERAQRGRGRGGGAADSADSTAAGRGRGGRGPTDPLLARRGPTQCHDITAYPAIGLAGGACGGYGLLLDIRDPANPTRIGAVADSNFSFWHSATFSNDGSKMLFSDEWGGGSQPRCRATDKPEWGADAIFTLQGNTLTFASYYKMPAAQTPQENCVAHNGSLLPIPGRDVMVQGWYQGGISVFDWTDPKHPKEIAFFDRGPVDATRLVSGGSWSVYWYNGYIISSEIFRGLDVFELAPSAFISQNEIDAARSVRLDYLNAQGQPKFVWPSTFAIPRSYLDQLERSQGLAANRIAALRNELARVERLGVEQRRAELRRLSTQIDTDAATATDQAKVRQLASAVTDLANAQR